ncbi:MAG: lysophospholipid acyltransferase family protein [Candidatus Eisenbacteria bacterium]|nr:lysophospholipid acyltransferase family protein [Candidatus Eisenbacteria bacterium]
MSRLSKLSDALVFHLAVRLGPVVIRILGSTWRVRWFGEEHLESCRSRGMRVLYAFWHGRLLPLTFTHRGRRIHILISRHRDGEMIRRVTESLGFGSVRGSTGRGGARAILEMARRASEGYDLAITPDGPRGPRESAEAGVVRIAQRAGVPILPLASASNRGLTLGSWDRFRIPAPFARVAVGYGPPIDVPRTLSPEEVEEARARVENALVVLSKEADRLCGAREST